MSLQTRKIEFIQEFLKIPNEEVITQLENLLKSINRNYYDENALLKLISIQEFNSRIDQSENDFKNGKYRTTSELLEKYK